MTDNKNTTEWASYRRHDFVFENRAATLVYPKFTAPGKPWIWRTEYFGSFSQVDLAMLEHGWYFVYINVSELWGGKHCLEIMRRFQEHVESEYGFIELPVLLGFSRGGYSAFNYAIRYKDKVGMLYLDAPLLDFRSLAEMKNSENPADGFKRLLKRFPGIAATAFDDVLLTPMDCTEEVAAAKIPIIIVAGDADEIVPYEENTAIFVKRYRELGGNIELIVKHGCKHHPHSLENPGPIADFIMKKRKYHG
ncbi:MAG: hypothetical protein A2017_16225 [Lentisphaerae bacterium GWF2_44_16]|nr:MAG: hypothetical protein A2017_16225 [Lentisphaerae bacterium GWF2_44_16]